MKQTTWQKKLLYVFGAIACFTYVVIRIITWHKLEQGIFVKGQGIITIIVSVFMGFLLLYLAFLDDKK